MYHAQASVYAEAAAPSSEPATEVVTRDRG
jgi:hypothetical protein